MIDTTPGNDPHSSRISQESYRNNRHGSTTPLRRPQVCFFCSGPSQLLSASSFHSDWSGHTPAVGATRDLFGSRRVAMYSVLKSGKGATGEQTLARLNEQCNRLLRLLEMLLKKKRAHVVLSRPSGDKCPPDDPSVTLRTPG